MTKTRFSIIASLAAFAVAITTVIFGPAYAVPNYPTAAEVSAAKANVQEQQKMVERIEGILDDLEVEVRALEKVALQRNEAHNQALEAVSVMAGKVEGLEAQVVDAGEKAVAAERQMAQIVARMYQMGTSGDPTLEIFFNPDSSADLLYRLGTQEMLAQRTEAIYQAALNQKAQAEQLANELDSARSELEVRREAAETLLDEAKAAASAVIKKVRESEIQRAEMMSLLATLKDTASDLERQRREGLEFERRQNLIKTAPTAPELYSVSEPDYAKVEIAIAFANEQLGKRYVLGGAGPNVWDCSGITMKAYAAAGSYIGWHSATAQFNVMASQKKLVPFQNVERGDLIWWSTEKAFSGDKYHVAIYLGDGMMLEAPNPARTVRIVPVRYGELWPYAGRPTAD